MTATVSVGSRSNRTYLSRHDRQHDPGLSDTLCRSSGEAESGGQWTSDRPGPQVAFRRDPTAYSSGESPAISMLGRLQSIWEAGTANGLTRRLSAKEEKLMANLESYEEQGRTISLLTQKQNLCDGPG